MQARMFFKYMQLFATLLAKEKGAKNTEIVKKNGCQHHSAGLFQCPGPH